MNDLVRHLKQRVRDSFDAAPSIDELAARTRRALTGLHRNESGATLTEFVIMLPIFILVFNGVMILGEFTRKGQEAPVRAYKQTFENVLPFQTELFKPLHMQTTVAAVDAGLQLGGPAKVHNISTGAKVAGNVSEGAAYVGLGAKGHMGESFARTNAATMMPGTKLQGCDSIGPSFPNDCTQLNDSSGLGAVSTSNNGKLTSDLEDLTGGSQYAKDLFNDGVDAQAFSGGGSGPLGMINSVVSAAGLRPVLAANVRYGTVYGEHHDSLTFAGRTMEMDAHFSTLVPPTPKGATLDAAVATAITRTTMESHGHYSNLLGIAWDQPLDSESFSVPAYP